MEDSAVSNLIIRRRIYRWMKRKKVTLRRVTHKAQNKIHHMEFMKDWVRYVLGQIKMLNIPYENVANFDETNLDFSVDGGPTLNSKGADTVAVKAGKSSDHRSRHKSGGARICPINDANTLDGIFKLAVPCYDALDQPHQVANPQVITTTSVDRAGATIVAGMETNNLKIALLIALLHFHGGGSDEDVYIVKLSPMKKTATRLACAPV